MTQAERAIKKDKTHGREKNCERNRKFQITNCT